MEQFLADCDASYYTNIIMIICAFSCSIIGFIKRNKFKELRTIFIYPLSSVIQTIFIYFIPFLYPEFELQAFRSYFNYSINVFLLIELVSIYVFFYQAILKYFL